MPLGYAAPAFAEGYQPFQRAINAPTLDLPTLSGRRTLDSWRPGQAAVVAFWATWCVPCRAELPAMFALRAALAPQDIAIVCVNVGEPAGKVAAFVDRLGLRDLDVALDPERAAAAAWRIAGVPTAYLVSASGRIAGLIAGETDWADPGLRRHILDLRTSSPSGRDA